MIEVFHFPFKFSSFILSFFVSSTDSYFNSNVWQRECIFSNVTKVRQMHRVKSFSINGEFVTSRHNYIGTYLERLRLITDRQFFIFPIKAEV